MLDSDKATLLDGCRTLNLNQSAIPNIDNAITIVTNDKLSASNIAFIDNLQNAITIVANGDLITLDGLSSGKIDGDNSFIIVGNINVFRNRSDLYEV
ncbi:MAG: hypothetical protein DRI57_25950 [Deltaproteobacteria bacterium]|nr:MAG: hypothetical protein DRI57_25950 [Deltaproteobacteria bacterium]